MKFNIIVLNKNHFPDYNQTKLPERAVPANFRSDFKPNHFIYNGNKIIVNKLYQEPKQSVVDVYYRFKDYFKIKLESSDWLSASM
ncbi:DUF2977 domain-containing protein [Listeria grayi]|uniref:Uncharacterized protein n=1 Tax=Listeria grayi DSM 20601 TaxID=525367 RepID=D7V0Q6_LISGR|nr:DUF2977 domain-containing protein [Listeria grayi]EFI83138.1 hypothetical protein HMPREF0556_11823 [Listeria grayi DSM 20601]